MNEISKQHIDQNLLLQANTEMEIVKHILEGNSKSCSIIWNKISIEKHNEKAEWKSCDIPEIK